MGKAAAVIPKSGCIYYVAVWLRRGRPGTEPWASAVGISPCTWPPAGPCQQGGNPSGNPEALLQWAEE